MNTPASSLNSDLENTPAINIDLSVSFAQKYLQQLKGDSISAQPTENHSIKRRRQEIAGRLLASLRSVSAKSWTRTENLLAQEILKHGVDTDLIDPWQISGGIHQVYKYAIAAYAQQQTPHRLVTQVSPILGQSRQRATAVDPRAIGFVAMQYHYTGMQLMTMLPDGEQESFATYVKVLDDHLYMPLQRAYNASARHPAHSLALRSVQSLMPNMTDIAERIVARVIQLYPRYRCYSGLLNTPNVRVSSVRDVEMFQVYMWVCLLEGNLQALQEELFPLCVMIYPILNVGWELTSLMTSLLRKEVAACLPLEQAKYCEPYYEILNRMFSPEVFPNPILS